MLCWNYHPVKVMCFLNESCVEAYRNWKYQRNADTIFTAVLMRALERQNLAVTVFIDESTVFDKRAMVF